MIRLTTTKALFQKTLTRNLSTPKNTSFNISKIKPTEPGHNFNFGLVSAITLFTIFTMTLPPSDFFPSNKNSGDFGKSWFTRNDIKKDTKHGIKKDKSSHDKIQGKNEIERTEFRNTRDREEVVSKAVIGNIVESSVVLEDSTNATNTSDNKETKEVPIIPNDLIKAKYVLVGGGTASYSAFLSLKQKSVDLNEILIISNEGIPYMRPPLSKECWQEIVEEEGKEEEEMKFKDWNGNQRSVFYEQDLGVSIINSEVTQIDGDAQVLQLKDGRRVKYEKVLLATGGRGKYLKWVDDLPQEIKSKVSTFRNISDYKKLKEIVNEGKDLVIYGGGFLGSELACSLAKYGKEKGVKVTQVFSEDGNMGLVFPKYLSQWTSNKVKEEGVLLKPKNQITKLTSFHNSDKLYLQLTDGTNLEADHIILALGIQPNTEFIKNSPKAGIELDSNGGIQCNAELEARKNIYAAGDVLSFYDVTLNLRRRVEHHDNAILSGRLAGSNMYYSSKGNNGGVRSYSHQSMFWSDLGPKVGYEAVGVLDCGLSTVGVWAKKGEKDTPESATKNENDVRVKAVDEFEDSSEAIKKIKINEVLKETKVIEKTNDINLSKEKYGKGVVFYLNNDSVIVGVLLWNMFGKTDLARKIIQDKKRVEDVGKLAKLFRIHDE